MNEQDNGDLRVLGEGTMTFDDQEDLVQPTFDETMDGEEYREEEAQEHEILAYRTMIVKAREHGDSKIDAGFKWLKADLTDVHLAGGYYQRLGAVAAAIAASEEGRYGWAYRFFNLVRSANTELIEHDQRETVDFSLTAETAERIGDYAAAIEAYLEMLEPEAAAAIAEEHDMHEYAQAIMDRMVDRYKDTQHWEVLCEIENARHLFPSDSYLLDKAKKEIGFAGGLDGWEHAEYLAAEHEVEGRTDLALKIRKLGLAEYISVTDYEIEETSEKETVEELGWDEADLLRVREDKREDYKKAAVRAEELAMYDTAIELCLKARDTTTANRIAEKHSMQDVLEEKVKEVEAFYAERPAYNFAAE
ncbi:hypothetical protein KY362_06900 [Candidatus Woesearchaeota archaeon]|nr:hypothetical protein [Candidatus Woesearchaeota archaeon]